MQRDVREREFFIDNLLVRIFFTIVMTSWTGLAPWEFRCLSADIHHMHSSFWAGPRESIRFSNHQFALV
jgi:hypothetical protein